MAGDLGLYLTAINKSKKNVMRDPENNDPSVISGYPAFIVRRLLSYHEDAVAAANLLNTNPHLDNQLQFEFLLHFLPKKNRYSPTHKVQTPEAVDLIKRFYNYSDQKALEVLSIHTSEDLKRIKAHFAEGGILREK